MSHSIEAVPASSQIARCPYCKEKTEFALPADYAPVYAWCRGCGKKFIAERRREGFRVVKVEGAPCGSDPDCREIEIGAGDEE
jgi:hypothetical protein